MLATILLLIAYLAVPLLIGRLTGVVLKRTFEGRRRKVAFACLAVVFLSTLFVPLPDPWISVHDQAVLVLLFLGAAFARPRPAGTPFFSRRRVSLALVALAATAIGATALEVGARLMGPRPLVHVEAPGGMNFVFHQENRDWRCRALYPHHYGWTKSYPPRSARRRVLHVGDSLVVASEVTQEQHFATHLDAQRPNEEHVTLALGGIDPATYLVLIRKWLDRVAPDEVMVHIFLGNDLQGVDTTYGCCTGQQLLTTLPDGGLSETCPSPQWRDGVPERWIIGPPPYPLRFLANYSMAAVRAMHLLERVSFDLRSGWAVHHAKPETSADRVARFGEIAHAIAAELRARKLPVVFSLIPPRWALVGDDPGGEMRELHTLVTRFFATSGLAYIDAWQHFDEAVRKEPSKTWFFTDNIRNPHFDVHGHKSYAEWLDRVWFGRPAPVEKAAAPRGVDGGGARLP